MPRLLASSSSSVSRFTRQRSRPITERPTTIGMALQRREVRLVLVRLPISQKVICWRTSLGSATYLIIVTPALHSAIIIDPVSTRLRVWLWADLRLMRYEAATAATPPAKAASCTR